MLDLPLSDTAVDVADAHFSPAGLDMRRAHVSNRITFYTPGLRRYKTAEYAGQDAAEFVSVSLTGTACALGCEHCGKTILRGLTSLPYAGGSLYDLCARLAERGARGVLISGGSDARGRVPLHRHIPDLIRVRRELGLVVRVHPGLPDEETCAGLAEAGIDGAMVDIIGDQDTIRQVYHLGATPDDYEAALARLERHAVPTVPHIILGLHFGQMRGERRALEMIACHPPKMLALVVLTPLRGTPMAEVRPPELADVGRFFKLARAALPATPIVLGCERPLGDYKRAADRLAIDAGLDGIAYPADGTVAYARDRRLEPHFIDACCGVAW
ncbi:MAG: radical SAM protein [Kouleothrix sp.]|nr:radical SAM protein [Kouleothrix sp.]